MSPEQLLASAFDEFDRVYPDKACFGKPRLVAMGNGYFATVAVYQIDSDDEQLLKKLIDNLEPILERWVGQCDMYIQPDDKSVIGFRTLGITFLVQGIYIPETVPRAVKLIRQILPGRFSELRRVRPAYFELVLHNWPCSTIVELNICRDSLHTLRGVREVKPYIYTNEMVYSVWLGKPITDANWALKGVA